MIHKKSKNTIQHWTSYSLIDCGDGKKLERFGQVVLIRPEPSAIWPAKLSREEWVKMAYAECVQLSNNKAEWKRYKDFKSNWNIEYTLKGKSLMFNLQLTRFKHVGLFPEHYVNWNFIYDSVRAIGPEARVLNLFAYTGGASLAAKAAGADVVHVDSIKQVISWAKENMSSSKLKDIRWVVEDALKFISRENKRGNTYDGIILDPPSFGLGSKGERWKLEESINELISQVRQVLNPTKSFVVLNTYSPSFTPLVVDNLLKAHFPHAKSLNSKELFLLSESGYKMPTGVTGTISNI